MSAFRLPTGGAVDRARPLAFTFNRRRYAGLAGDTLASALLANGVHLVGRSFKYHRPRGIFGAGFEETGAIVQLADAPNELATRLELTDGLDARSVNCWPGPRFDLGALAQAASRLLGAGFYYKTFMWPDWHLFEPAIRKAAGLGRAPRAAAAHGACETRFGHCDILVVGAGPAGLMAALAAARSGARVMLVDDGLAPGGRLLADARRIDDRPAATWIDAVVAELRQTPTVRILVDATVWGYLEHNMLALVERRPGAPGLRQRSWKLRAGQVVIASGAFERPIPFAGSDRPGVMLAGAARSYVNRYAVRPGERAVVFTNNDGAYDAAADLACGGIAVTVVDSRPAPPGAARARLADLPIEVIAGTVVQEALGRGRVHGVAVVDRQGGAARTLACDLVCVSGGWNPAFHLASQSREVRAAWREDRATFVPQPQSRRLHVAGAARGSFDLQACLADGAAAGAAAAQAMGFPAAEVAVPRADDEAGATVDPLWYVPPTSRSKKVFVDLVNDVTVADLALALREGYDHIEHVKRYTTAGMGLDQGKTVNVNVIGAVAAMRGLRPEDVGTTTFRQPYVPVEFGAIAGHRSGVLRTPMRRSPMFDWHVASGAVIYEAGLRWQRPGCYPQPGETIEQATAREARAVRERVGVYDGSPLGKLLVKGPDAAALLDLLYVNDWASLKPGCGRYGVMLWEDGLVMDDGVTFRLDAQSYLLHSSTGAAERVTGHIEELLQVHYPDLRVAVIPVTSQWANVTVCGPLAREVIRAAGTDIDIARDAFPFMTLREGRVAGLPVRATRVSWTGELSIELNTPARHGLALWKRILAAGQAFGITPVGSEANHVLRVEAGYISTGHETDGVVDVIDLGLGWMVSKTKRDFIGKRAMAIGRAANPQRRELVGYLPADPERLVPEGAPITPRGARTDSEGFVSACVRSVALNRSIALGLLVGGRARMGETVYAKLPGDAIPMTVVAPVFHDADRARVKG